MTLKLLVFDLDQTLAPSKSEMSWEMAELLEQALQKYSIAVISGGAYSQFQKQFLTRLALTDESLKKLSLFPTCATSFYRWEGDWKKVYAFNLSQIEKDKIMEAFKKCFEEIKFEPPYHIYGEILEDRETQITFSALGQRAPLELKKDWDPFHLKRLAMIEVLQKYIPEFEIKTGGTSSIDICQPNINKAYGIRQMEKHLDFTQDEMLFIADAIFPGGNDYAVKEETKVQCIEVANPDDTMRVIKELFEKDF